MKPFSKIGAFLRNKVMTGLTAQQLLVAAAMKDPDLTSGKVSGYVKANRLTLRAIELKAWQTAIALATNYESLNRLPLYTIYDRVDYDDMVETAVKNRIAPVKQSKFRWVNEKTGEENEELTQAFQKLWFYDFIGYAMESRFWGHSLVEVKEVDDQGFIKKVTLVNRRHVKADKKIVVEKESDTKGLDYSTPPIANWVFEIGDVEDLGIYCKVVPFVATKSLINNSWSIFTEKYGMPARTVTTQSTDKKRLDALADMMSAFGTDQWAVLNGDEKIDLLSINAQNGSSDNFERYLLICDKGIERMILGTNALISAKDNTGTYGGLKAVMEVSEYHTWDDKTFIAAVINDFKDKFQLFGYKLDGHLFEWDNFEEMSNDEMIKAIPQIAPYAELDWQRISEKTGIPILGAKKSTPGDPLGK